MSSQFIGLGKKETGKFFLACAVFLLSNEFGLSYIFYLLHFPKKRWKKANKRLIIDYMPKLYEYFGLISL